ncbi:VWA domain-containing protein [Crateriforma conspicua]|uniref:von Willebrand factor type A domain protein n=1 Tax=Crateriforma conspicua TaxID=2527996 RepID=A0A5C6FZS6_9PLAN|nr:VWA domain-containing protein [Crateriforma conspicua]TWU67115.1 von Willebrand factor type A domain protein [Crateriforma conspicua]
MLSWMYPWVFLLWPLPWLVRWLFPPVKTVVTTVKVPFGRRLQEANASTSAGSVDTWGWPRWLVAVSVWTLMLAATARPQWILPPIQKELPVRDLLLLVDLSGSMQQEDFVNAAGKKVDRLSAVKEVLGEFLMRRKGDRVGLVVFGDAAYLQAPFSTDLELSRKLLDECQVGMAGPRTALGDAIGLGVHLFDDSDAPAKTMIALTDGNDTKSRVPPVEAARVAKQRDIKIYTVAIGDPTTVGEDKLDEQALRDVASATGGDYFFAADRKNLESIYDKLDQIEVRKVRTVSHKPRVDVYFAAVAVVLLILLIDRLVRAMAAARQTALKHDAPKIRVDAMTGKLEVTR